MSAATDRQSELFDQIHDRYYESGFDEYANAYKDEFLRSWILSQIGESKSLIEIACGDGATSHWLRDRRPTLEIAGCDISSKAVEAFKSRKVGECYLADMTKPFHLNKKFDAVIVMGGIHHLVHNLDAAFSNIEELLNDDGLLIMAEPNADYVLEPLRRLWYALDKSLFDNANEHALSHDDLLKKYGRNFQLVDVAYFGGPAYFLLNLNYVLRLPNSAKRWIGPVAMNIERAYGKLPGRLPFASFMASWRKRAKN